jgi:hypothetical protein
LRQSRLSLTPILSWSCWVKIPPGALGKTSAACSSSYAWRC